MKKFIYYPITPYHIILSFILREHNKNHHNSIILDEFIFAKSFINKVSGNSNWERVYTLRKFPRLQNYVYRYILYKLKYNEVFQMRHANLVFFTFDNEFNNLLVNSVYKDNNVVMGEDGIFPYYGLDVAKDCCHGLLHESKVKKLKRLAKYFLHEKLTLDNPCGSTGRKGFPFFRDLV